jgi:glucose/mannose transport system substrate-binding protein
MMRAASVLAPSVLRLAYDEARFAEMSEDDSIDGLPALDAPRSTPADATPGQAFGGSEAAPVDGGRIRHLLRDNLQGIARYLGRLGIPSSEVDDVAQEVFVVAASKLAGVPSGSDRPFLYAIASRVAHNARRADTRRRRAYERYVDIGSDPVPTQEELSDQLRARTLFDSVLRDMTPELRGVFLLCEVEGLAVPEIARRLALPTGTAASRLRRARETFFERVARARSLRVRRGESVGFDDGPEIMSWWVSDGEVDALRALLDIYRRSHPGTSVVHGGIRDTTHAKFRMTARMTEGTPPDTFQANGGHDLLQWARGTTAGSLEPLEFLFEDEDWRSVFPADLLDLVSSGGEAYAVPLNIHRTNTLLYDVQAFNKASIDAPRTLDELHGAAASLRRQGINPLALGTRQPWMLSLITFENLLVALAGPRFYVEFLKGQRSPRAPEVRAAIEELGRLLDASNPDADRLSWDEAADRVRIGAAAMTVGGDWAKGYLERRGCLEGEHFALTPSPGTSHAFVFTIDTFGLPRGAPHREGAIELLRIFGSPQGQSVFNRIKGSRPARSDVGADVTGFASASVGVPSQDDFQTTVRVPTLTSLVPPAVSGALDAALAEFARTRDVGDVLGVIERQYAFIGN